MGPWITWALRLLVGGLWLSAGAWKAERFWDVRIFLASFAGMPYSALSAAVGVLGPAEALLGLLCLSGLAPRPVAAVSLGLAAAFLLAKALWPRRAGTRPPCACVPWARPRPTAATRAADALGEVLPDLVLVAGSAALFRLGPGAPL